MPGRSGGSPPEGDRGRDRELGDGHECHESETEPDARALGEVEEERGETRHEQPRNGDQDREPGAGVEVRDREARRRAQRNRSPSSTNAAPITAGSSAKTNATNVNGWKNRSRVNPTISAAATRYMRQIRATLPNTTDRFESGRVRP